jgi:hypothetical protein
VRYSCAIDQFKAKPSTTHIGTLLFASIPLLCASKYPLFSKESQFTYGGLPQVARIRATVLPSNHQLQMYNQHTCYLQTRHPSTHPSREPANPREASHIRRQMTVAKSNPWTAGSAKTAPLPPSPNPPTTHRTVPFQFSASPVPPAFQFGSSLPPNPNQGPRMLSVHCTSPDLSHQHLLLLLLLLLLRSPRLGRRTIIIIIIPPYSPGAAAAMGDA